MTGIKLKTSLVCGLFTDAKSLVRCLRQTRHLKFGHSSPCCPLLWPAPSLSPPHVHSRADCPLHLTLQFRERKGATPFCPLAACPGGMPIYICFRANLKPDQSEVSGHSSFSEKNSTSQGALNSGGKNPQQVSIFTICIWPQEEPPDDLFCFNIFCRPFDI